MKTVVVRWPRFELAETVRACGASHRSGL